MSLNFNLFMYTHVCVFKCSLDVKHVFWQFAGVYGIVLRVKILFNKKDTALVQFADPVQAQNGKVYLLFLCFCTVSDV